jgi:hypothetical protein
LQNELVKKFNDAASSHVVPLGDLTIERPYPIEAARPIATKFGDSILLSLRDAEQALVKVFLPRRFCGAFTEEHLEAINRGTLSLRLVYKGKSAQSGMHLLAIE